MLNLTQWFLKYGVLPIGGGAEETPGDEGKKGGEETVPKAELETAAAALAKTKQDLEDMRLEVLSPDYLDYLATRDKPAVEVKKPAEETPKGEELSDEQIEKLSKKELLILAKKKAEATFKGELESIKKSVEDRESEATQVEVAAFARKHEDYETYRPVMYGLSLDPKNTKLTIQELYDLSKEHVKGIRTETTKAEQERQQKLGGEKPGGSSESVERLRKLSPEAAAAEANAEVEAKLGPIPNA